MAWVLVFDGVIWLWARGLEGNMACNGSFEIKLKQVFKMGHGGKRTGSGRKKGASALPRVAPPEIKQELREIAREHAEKAIGAGMSKLVSILIPCFNAERWIGQAIETALVQTYMSTEIIVVDDGSTDGSLEVLRSFGQHAPSRGTPGAGPEVGR